MSYQNGKKDWDSGRNYQKEYDRFQFPELNNSLTEEFNDAASLYLPNGIAAKYAKVFKNIPNHQMRKILDLVKDAVLVISSDNDLSQFKIAQKQLFVIVAMSAYNAGRDSKLELLYDFIRKTVNEKTIRGIEDIKTFDQLFTSIVAYHKQFNKK